jgi:ppGpp synthetase/RelA/SpoT-type nucleotidyltranferase
VTHDGSGLGIAVATGVKLSPVLRDSVQGYRERLFDNPGDIVSPTMPQLSNRQLDELGDRLRGSDPTAEDLKLLGQVRSLYAGPLAEVTRVLVDLGLEPGGRLKTTGTLIDKLRRIPGMQLSRIQDVAGARVVADMTRREQDRLVERITARFDDYRVKDRRAEPSYGYRAVHVIVRVQGRLVEIQVRTHLQDLWAQIVERLADAWGRGIRYGEPPSEPDLPVEGTATRQEFVQAVMEFAEAVNLTEEYAELLAEKNRLREQLEARGVELPPSLETDPAEDAARLEEGQQRTRELLLELHNRTEADRLKS